MVEDVEGDIDLRVPQMLLDNLWVDPVLNHEAGGRMTQVVEPDVRQASLGERRLVHAWEVPGFLRGADRRLGG